MRLDDIANSLALHETYHEGTATRKAPIATRSLHGKPLVSMRAHQTTPPHRSARSPRSKRRSSARRDRLRVARTARAHLIRVTGIEYLDGCEKFAAGDLDGHARCETSNLRVIEDREPVGVIYMLSLAHLVDRL